MVLWGQTNDTIFKTPYKDIWVQSFDARGIGSLTDDCIKEFGVQVSGGYVYLIAYDNEGNSGEVLKFPYKGILAQGFSNPANTDGSPDCVYKFISSKKGDTTILSVIYDGTNRNDPDTADIFKGIYRGILTNEAGFPTPTGGYYAIRSLIGGTTSDGFVYLRADTTFNLTPIEQDEKPIESSSDTPLKFQLNIHLMMRGVVELVYTIPKEGDVELSIYDIAGRRIFHLKERSPKGIFTLRRRLPSGVYIASLKWNGREVLKKFISF